MNKINDYFIFYLLLGTMIVPKFFGISIPEFGEVMVTKSKLFPADESPIVTSTARLVLSLKLDKVGSLLRKSCKSTIRL